MPFILIYAVLLIGLALGVAGVAVVAGLGWSLIAASAGFCIVAFILTRGLS